MKILIQSDLHLNCLKKGALDAYFEDLAKRLKSSPVEVFALAGDIYQTTSYDALQTIFERFSEAVGPDTQILKVPGNHAYYQTSVSVRQAQFERLNQSIPNLHILDNQAVVVEGQRFIMGTGWFSRASDQSPQDRQNINDFWLIEGFVPWVYHQNRHFNALLKRELCETDVIITHHLPSWMSVAPQFKNSRLNQFFVNDCERLIKERQPKAIIHGHTHVPTSYHINKTLVICNPLGYPGGYEGKEFNPFLTIDV